MAALWRNCENENKTQDGGGGGWLVCVVLSRKVVVFVVVGLLEGFCLSVFWPSSWNLDCSLLMPAGGCYFWLAAAYGTRRLFSR